MQEREARVFERGPQGATPVATYCSVIEETFKLDSSLSVNQEHLPRTHVCFQANEKVWCSFVREPLCRESLTVCTVAQTACGESTRFCVTVKTECGKQ